MSNQQQLPKESVSLNNKKYNINAPFAPGTYIELEITPPQSNIMQWSFIEINSQKALQNLLNETTNIHSLTIHSLLDKNQISNKQYNVQILTDDNNVIDTNKLGFSLPITRDNEETFDKYYIIVFVYDANKQKPTLQDAYIIIDMSFRVGIGGDNAVKAINKDINKLFNNINECNQIANIDNLIEATHFLQIIKKDIEKITKTHKNNLLQYCKNNSQIIGKIAYIYYRFDLGNDGFVESIFDSQEYLVDRNRFIKKVIEAYSNNGIRFEFYKLFHLNGINIDTEKQQEPIKHFIEAIGNNLHIPQCSLIHNMTNIVSFSKTINCMPTVTFNKTNGNTYHYESNTINIKTIKTISNETRQKDLEELVNAIIHEFRHFYIYYVVDSVKTQNSVFKFIYHQIYFSAYFDRMMFIAFDKQCAVFDIDGIFYTKNGHYGNNRKVLPLYYLQPKERDARKLAFDIINQIFRKNAPQ